MKNSTCSLQNSHDCLRKPPLKNLVVWGAIYALVLPWVPWKLEPSSWDAWASGWGWLAFHRREIQVTETGWWCNNHHEKYESMGRMTTHIWNGKSKPCLKPPTSRNMETRLSLPKRAGKFRTFYTSLVTSRSWWMHFASPTSAYQHRVKSNRLILRCDSSSM